MAKVGNNIVAMLHTGKRPSRHDRGIESESFAGRDGVALYFERLRGAWDYFHVTPERYLEGDGLVLVLGRLEGRGRGSGATVDSALGMAFDLHDGAITRIRGYLDRDEALAAVGLAGQA